MMGVANVNKMADRTVDLERKKTLLCTALKDKTPQYWDLMKSWYKQKISKEEFDKKAKLLLGDAGIQLHNDFLFSILIKCHTVSSQNSGNPYLPPSAGIGGGQGFERVTKRPKIDSIPSKDTTPFGVFNETKYSQPPTAMVSGKDLDRILMCSHELLLPDLPTLHTRILLLAWESGLHGASEDTAQYMSKAIEMFLKSVLTACITSKTNWRIKSDKYQHGFSKGYNPLISSTSKRQLQTTGNRRLAIEAMEAEHNAKTTKHSSSESINCFDLRDTLRTYGTTCIPSYSVRAMVMERVLGNMWHPSSIDLSNIESIARWKRFLMK